MQQRAGELLIEAFNTFHSRLHLLWPCEGIAMHEFRILKFLQQELDSGKTVSVSDIKNQSPVTMAAISQSLRGLESKALIERGIDSADRRKIWVNVTDEGRRVLVKIKSTNNMWLSNMLTELGTDDTEQLLRILTKLTDLMAKDTAMH